MKIFKLIIGITFLFALVACSNQNENTPINKEAVLDISLKGCTSRNIIEGNMLPNGSQMGVFVVDANENIKGNNVPVNYVDGVCQMTKPVYLNEEEMYVYAYYPYDKSASIKEMQVNTDTQTDCLFGYAVNDNDVRTTVNSNQPKADVLLKHILSRITLSFKKAENIETELSLRKIIFEGTNSTGTFDIQKGEFITLNKGALIKELNLELSSENQNVDLLTIPTDNVGYIRLFLELNDKSYSVLLPEGTWKSGQQYTYTVIIENGNLSIELGEITPWNDNESDGIEINDNNYIKS